MIIARTGGEKMHLYSGSHVADKECKLPMGKACRSEGEVAQHQRKRTLPDASASLAAVPHSLTPKERELFEELQKTSSFNPRQETATL